MLIKLSLKSSFQFVQHTTICIHKKSVCKHLNVFIAIKWVFVSEYLSYGVVDFEGYF
jgi:hypothetical protein